MVRFGEPPEAAILIEEQPIINANPYLPGPILEQ
jgi:hypothetical protein